MNLKDVGIQYIDVYFPKLEGRNEALNMKEADKRDIMDSALVLRRWRNTKNPFIVAEAMGIEIEYVNIDISILEGYSYYSKTKMQIKINSNLNKKRQMSICAHELGHIVLEHTGVTYYKDNDLEKEYCANLFGVAFLYLLNGYDYDDIINLPNYALQTILSKR